VRGNVQKELEHQRTVVDEHALECADVLEPLLPDARRHQPLRQLLALQQFGMDPHDQDLLVVRAVEDADPPARGQPPRDAPEKIVVELLGAGALNACTSQPIGLTPDITCLTMPSLPLASMPWRTTSTDQRCWA